MATTIGTVSLNGCKYHLKYDLLKQDIENNSSTVRLYGVLEVTNNYIAWDRGEASVHTSGLQPIGTYYGNGEHTLITRDFDFYHDENGNFSAYIGAELKTTFVSGSCGGVLTLPSIEQYPILESGTDFKDNENPVYTIKAYGKYPIRVKLEAGGNDHLITRDLTSKNSQVYTLELTDSERQTLRNMMTGNSLNVIETVCAMSGGNEIFWSFKEYKMTKGTNYSKVRINGEWKDAVAYVRVNGEWKEATPYIRINNQWKEGI